MDHPESKSEGTIGQLERKHVKINKYSIVHIGKETNELDESMIIGVNEDNYSIYEDKDAKIKK